MPDVYSSVIKPLRPLCIIICVVLALPLAILAPAGSGSSLKYDQSQAGDYNVQVHLKNIEVYAILDDSGSFGNEQYDYDYSDMTLKPPKPSDGSVAITFKPPSKTTTGKDDENATISQEQSEVTDVTTVPTTSTQATQRSTRRCGAGFYRDHFGRCRRVRHPQLPLLSLSNLPRKNPNKPEEEGKISSTTPK